jgi:hypothetical protein
MGYEFHCVCGFVTTVETDGERPDEVICSLCGKIMKRKKSKTEGGGEPFVVEQIKDNVSFDEAEVV